MACAASKAAGSIVSPEAARPRRPFSAWSDAPYAWPSRYCMPAMPMSRTIATSARGSALR